MTTEDKIITRLMVILAIGVIVGLSLFWVFSMQQAELDQQLAVQCVDQGGTPLYINGHMSCLHKIARIA